MQSEASAPQRRSAYYPLFVDLDGYKTVVVGGGRIAQHKIETLLEYGARVTVVAPKCTDVIYAWSEEGIIELVERPYEEGDLDQARIAFCACGDPSVDAQVRAEAQKLNCLINVVDQPESCDFFVPSIVQRGNLGIAISTSGTACAVAKRIRLKLEDEFDDSWNEYLELMGQVRALVKDRISGGHRMRKPILDAAADADWRQRLIAGEKITADEAYAEAVAAVEAM